MRLHLPRRIGSARGLRRCLAAALIALLPLLLTHCAGREPGPDLALTPATFSSLSGWAADDHEAALPALRRSCAAILKQPPARQAGPRPEFGSIGEWQPACRALQAAGEMDATAARRFFERHFLPYQVSGAEGREGLFTGYFEAGLRGARRPDAVHRHPLYRLPPELDGAKPAGYHDRAAIEAGALAGRGLELVWVDDPVDAFFLHIQGSGRVELAGGGEMRVGYAGQNGQPYFAIGRALIDSGEVPKEEMSMQAIRAWLAANPDRAADLMNLNKSYIFFRELQDEGGPIGAQGVPLTPERSLAVDRNLFAYGLPVWLDTTVAGDAPPPPSGVPLRRLLIAQDTGGAIRGAVRGDVFWGHGPEAAARAGRMRDAGRMWVLVPRPVVARPGG